jgi:DNA-binding transcriptional LysR family regulator
MIYIERVNDWNLSDGDGSGPMERTRVGFTLRDIENVVALADCGSVTLAAARLELSQPAMSSALKSLETALGTTLFVRHRGQGISLTPEGHRFAAEGRTIIARARQLQAEIAGRHTDGSGILLIGALSTVAPVVAGALLRSFVEQHPRVRPELTTGSQDQILQLLTSGSIHLALTYDLGLDEGLRFERLVDTMPHVMLSAAHPLARRKRLGLDELVDEPYILLDLPMSRDYFTSFFLTADLPDRPVARYTDLALVRSMVGNGFGYSLVNLLPARAEALDATQLAYIPLDTQVPSLSLGIVLRPDEHQLRAAQEFIDHARRHFAVIPPDRPYRAPTVQSQPRPTKRRR